MIYPKKINANISERLIKIFLLSSIVLALILLFINRITTPNVPWAALANGGIVYIWVTVIYSIRKNTNIAGHVLIQTLAISLLTVFIDYKLGFNDWSIEIAIPIIIMIANITMLVLTIVGYKKYIKYAIYQLVIVLFSMLPVLFIQEKIVNNITLSIISSSISILNFILCLILCAKDIKEAVIRKFHM